MPSKNINHAAAWVGAIVFFLWGYVWHQILFKSQYTAFMSQMGSTMMPTSSLPYIAAIVSSLVIGYGTAIALAGSEKASAAHGISFGIFMGIVFYASVTLVQALFRNQGAWWLLEAGFALIGFAIVGAIVGGWKRRAAAA